jgi:hypothetical protein
MRRKITMDDKVIKVSDIKPILNGIVTLYKNAYELIGESELIVDKIHELNNKTPENEKLYEGFKERMSKVKNLLSLKNDDGLKRFE